MKNLAVCTIVKNEGLYIEEWLEFHLLQGVEHFFIYDNESSDGLPTILAPYIRAELVTYKLWPGTAQQMKTFAHCIENYRDFAKWMAFIDVDEFLYTDGSAGSVMDFLSMVAAPGLAVRWYLFGSSGELVYRPELVIRRFTHRCPTPNKHVKSIVQPAEVERVGNDPHYFYFKNGGRAVDENGVMLPEIYSVMEGGTAEKIAVNHYYTKSLEEAMIRWKEVRVSSGAVRPERMAEFEKFDFNEIQDLKAQRSVVASANRILINHYHTKSREEALHRWANPDPGSGNPRENIEEKFKAHDTNEIWDPRAELLAPIIEEIIRIRRCL